MTIKIINVIATAAATLALSAATAFAADGNFDRTLNVSGSPNVSVSTGSGYIHLTPGSGSQVHIVAHLRSSHGWMSGGNDVDSRIQQIVNNPPIVQNGNDITIGASGEDYAAPHSIWELRFEAKAERARTEGALQVRGQFALTQTEYKIKPYTALLGMLKLKDELRVHGDLLLVPKPAK